MQTILSFLGKLTGLQRRRSLDQIKSEYEKWKDLGSKLHLVDSPHKYACADSEIDSNPLAAYFSKLSSGPGVWKWLHYFDIYHQYLQRFRGKKCTMMEIGVYSGGSLPMWRHYFGEDAEIIGVDVEPACKAYACDKTRILIGDQEDRKFWKSSLADFESIDIVIDDGGHTPTQQRVTFEEVFPKLAPGGVYICEDIHHKENPFSGYVQGIADQLNEMSNFSENLTQPEFRLSCDRTKIQQLIYAVHFHPFVVVIEKGRGETDFRCPKRGTEWQPFLT